MLLWLLLSFMLGLRSGWVGGRNIASYERVRNCSHVMGLCVSQQCQLRIGCYIPWALKFHYNIQNELQIGFQQQKWKIWGIILKFSKLFSYWNFSYFYPPHSSIPFFQFDNNLARTSCSSSRTLFFTRPFKFYRSRRRGGGGYKDICWIFMDQLHLTLEKKRREIIKCSGDVFISNFLILRLADCPHLSRKLWYSEVLIELFQIKFSPSE